VIVGRLVGFLPERQNQAVITKPWFAESLWHFL
jgi:hypothetical protein